MTSRELLYVKTVAEEKNISRAAKKLFIAQPSLSQSIQRIEETLGIPLFNRTANGLTLTGAGERYYQTACQILKLYADLETEISDLNDMKTGRIHAGITNHLGTIVLPQILPQFCSDCPHVELFVTEETTGRLEADVLSGALDFAILHAPKKDPHPMLCYEYLAEDPFVIALQQGHPLIKKAQTREGYPHPVLDLALLRQEPFLMLHKEQRIRHVSDSILSQANITPRIILTLRSYETAKRLAGAGIGITLLPESYTQISCLDCPPALLSIDRRYRPSWNLGIATLRGGFLSRADQHFLTLVRNAFSHDGLSSGVSST